MKTINNMKAMEINEEMLDRAIGGNGLIKHYHPKETHEAAQKMEECALGFAASVGEGLLNTLTCGIFSTVKNGYILFSTPLPEVKPNPDNLNYVL